jgi:phenylalanine-4-hydroxylase
MKQQFEMYTSEDREVWKLLFERQRLNLESKGSSTYLECLEQMKPVLNADSLPNFRAIEEWFKDYTGWSIEVVPGIIPVNRFFKLLANNRFCSSTWLRSKNSLDYLEEPDMFHDIFGHIPLLCNPVFSSFMKKFGEIGVKHVHDPLIELQLQRLYWFTIEFGVIKEDKVKSYGAGIMSSFGETNLVDKGEVEFVPFDLNQIIQNDFRTDVVQGKYFVLNSFDELFDSLKKLEQNLLNKTNNELASY